MPGMSGLALQTFLIDKGHRAAGRHSDCDPAVAPARGLLKSNLAF